MLDNSEKNVIMDKVQFAKLISFYTVLQIIKLISLYTVLRVI
jgi:hypothetical protein